MNSKAITHIKQLPLITANQLHIYKIDLTEFFDVIDALDIPYLSLEEKDRINRYKFQKDKIRFGVGRFILRQIFNIYTQHLPESIKFSFNKFGKPYFKNNENLKFNISHSGNLLLIGLNKDYEVGVDTEIYNKKIDHLDLAKSVFSKQEQAALLALPKHKMISAFYNCWSLKESFIKAVGLGLQIPLDQFSVNFFKADNTNSLIDVSWKPALLNKLISKIIYLEKNYSAACTYDKNIKSLQLYELTKYAQLQLSNKLKLLYL